MIAAYDDAETRRKALASGAGEAANFDPRGRPGGGALPGGSAGGGNALSLADS
jgi:hypothetical protein